MGNFLSDNGKTGIEFFRQDPLDLVITDIIMPEKEGLETIQELRFEFPDVKIIAISGGGKGGENNYLQMAQGFGAEITFSKETVKFFV